MSTFNGIAVDIFIVDSSPLLRNSKFLKREIPDTGGDSDAMNSTDDVLFRDYLKQQIDHLMTGDAGRDGVAEGRRGTHVEVLLPIYKQHPQSGVNMGSYIYVRRHYLLREASSFPRVYMLIEARGKLCSRTNI